MKKFIIITLVAVFSVLAVVAGRSVAHAQGFRTGDDVTVATGEVVDGTLFSAARTVDIAGTVNGDVYCAGMNITISGTVNGDVICAGQNIQISGTVQGDVRLAAQTVNISGTVAHNASLGGQSIVTSQSSKIGSDILLGGTDVTLNGPVGRDVVAGGNTLTITNTIGRNIHASVTHLTFGSSAQVGGTVDYTSNNDAVVSSGAKVSSLQRTTPKSNGVRKWTIFRFAFFFTLMSVLALLVVSIGLALLAPAVFQSSSKRALDKPWRVLLTGFIGLVAAPIVFVTLMVTFIGIPLALLMGLIWLVVLFLSGPFFSYWLGRLVWRGGHNVLLTMLIGVLIVMFVYLIPFLGVLMGMAVLFMGTGIVLSELLAHFRKPNYRIK